MDRAQRAETGVLLQHFLQLCQQADTLLAPRASVPLPTASHSQPPRATVRRRGVSDSGSLFTIMEGRPAYPPGADPPSLILRGSCPVPASSGGSANSSLARLKAMRLSATSISSPILSGQSRAGLGPRQSASILDQQQASSQPQQGPSLRQSASGNLRQQDSAQSVGHGPSYHDPTLHAHALARVRAASAAQRRHSLRRSSPSTPSPAPQTPLPTASHAQSQPQSQPTAPQYELATPTSQLMNEPAQGQWGEDTQGGEGHGVSWQQLNDRWTPQQSRSQTAHAHLIQRSPGGCTKVRASSRPALNARTRQASAPARRPSPFTIRAGSSSAAHTPQAAHAAYAARGAMTDPRQPRAASAGSVPSSPVHSLLLDALEALSGDLHTTTNTYATSTSYPTHMPSHHHHQATTPSQQPQQQQHPGQHMQHPSMSMAHTQGTVDSRASWPAPGPTHTLWPPSNPTTSASHTTHSSSHVSDSRMPARPAGMVQGAADRVQQYDSTAGEQRAQQQVPYAYPHAQGVLRHSQPQHSQQQQHARRQGQGAHQSVHAEQAYGRTRSHQQPPEYHQQQQPYNHSNHQPSHHHHQQQTSQHMQQQVDSYQRHPSYNQHPGSHNYQQQPGVQDVQGVVSSEDDAVSAFTELLDRQALCAGVMAAWHTLTRERGAWRRRTQQVIASKCARHLLRRCLCAWAQRTRDHTAALELAMCVCEPPVTRVCRRTLRAWREHTVSMQGCPLSVLQCMAQVRLRLCWVVWRQWSVGHRALQDAAHAILAHTAERVCLHDTWQRWRRVTQQGQARRLSQRMADVYNNYRLQRQALGAWVSVWCRVSAARAFREQRDAQTKSLVLQALRQNAADAWQVSTSMHPWRATWLLRVAWGVWEDTVALSRRLSNRALRHNRARIQHAALQAWLHAVDRNSERMQLAAARFAARQVRGCFLAWLTAAQSRQLPLPRLPGQPHQPEAAAIMQRADERRLSHTSSRRATRESARWESDVAGAESDECGTPASEGYDSAWQGSASSPNSAALAAASNAITAALQSAQRALAAAAAGAVASPHAEAEPDPPAGAATAAMRSARSVPPPETADTSPGTARAVLQRALSLLQRPTSAPQPLLAEAAAAAAAAAPPGVAAPGGAQLWTPGGGAAGSGRRELWRRNTTDVLPSHDQGSTSTSTSGKGSPSKDDVRGRRAQSTEGADDSAQMPRRTQSASFTQAPLLPPRSPEVSAIPSISAMRQMMNLPGDAASPPRAVSAAGGIASHPIAVASRSTASNVAEAGCDPAAAAAGLAGSSHSVPLHLLQPTQLLQLLEADVQWFDGMLSEGGPLAAGSPGGGAAVAPDSPARRASSRSPSRAASIIAHRAQLRSSPSRASLVDIAKEECEDSHPANPVTTTQPYDRQAQAPQQVAQTGAAVDKVPRLGPSGPWGGPIQAIELPLSESWVESVTSEDECDGRVGAARRTGRSTRSMRSGEDECDVQTPTTRGRATPDGTGTHEVTPLSSAASCMEDEDCPAASAATHGSHRQTASARAAPSSAQHGLLLEGLAPVNTGKVNAQPQLVRPHPQARVGSMQSAHLVRPAGPYEWADARDGAEVAFQAGQGAYSVQHQAPVQDSGRAHSQAGSGHKPRSTSAPRTYREQLEGQQGTAAPAAGHSSQRPVAAAKRGAGAAAAAQPAAAAAHQQEASKAAAVPKRKPSPFMQRMEAAAARQGGPQQGQGAVAIQHGRHHADEGHHVTVEPQGEVVEAVYLSDFLVNGEASEVSIVSDEAGYRSYAVEPQTITKFKSGSPMPRPPHDQSCDTPTSRPPPNMYWAHEHTGPVSTPSGGLIEQLVPADILQLGRLGTGLAKQGKLVPIQSKTAPRATQRADLVHMTDNPTFLAAHRPKSIVESLRGDGAALRASDGGGLGGSMRSRATEDSDAWTDDGAMVEGEGDMRWGLRRNPLFARRQQ